MAHEDRNDRAEFNPYQPPVALRASEGDLRTGDEALATRGQRFVASLVDGIILMAVVVPVEYKAGMWDGFPNIQQPTYLEGLLWGAVGFVVFVAIHGYTLSKYAQSLGKRLVGIRIAKLDGQNAELSRILLWRTLPFQAASVMIPVVGPYVIGAEVLAIFRKDHRCIHDHVARTRVVKVTAI